MNSQSFCFETRALFRWSAFLGAVILLTLTAGFARRSSGTAGVGRTVRVHGRRLAIGQVALQPISDEERERGEKRGEAGGGDEHARLLRWIESRHRAAPGMSWGALEAANREAALASLAKAGGPQPVWHERGPLNMTGATSVTAVRADGKTLLVASSRSRPVQRHAGEGRVWTPITSSLGDGYPVGFKVSSPPETWVAAINQSDGGALYVSRNHGVAWSAPKGLPPLQEIDELVQDGGDRRTLYLLAWAARSDGSRLPILARSRDGGVSFAIVRRWSVAERAGAVDRAAPVRGRSIWCRAASSRSRPITAAASRRWARCSTRGRTT